MNLADSLSEGPKETLGNKEPGDPGRDECLSSALVSHVYEPEPHLLAGFAAIEGRAEGRNLPWLGRVLSPCP